MDITLQSSGCPTHGHNQHHEAYHHWSPDGDRLQCFAKPSEDKEEESGKAGEKSQEGKGSKAL